MLMIFWLVSPLSSCVLLPSYGHLGNKENHPASASTGSHPETLTDWSFPAPFIPYYAGSGLAGTKSRTHRGLGPHLFLFRSLFFFPSPSRCRTLEYGGFNPRYHSLQVQCCPPQSNFPNSWARSAIYFTWHGPRAGPSRKNTRTQGLLHKMIRKVISSHLPGRQARSQKSGQASLHFSLRKKGKGNRGKSLCIRASLKSLAP